MGLLCIKADWASFGQVLKFQAVLPHKTPNRHNCVAFKLVYVAPAKRNTLNHAGHVVIQKVNDFLRRIVPKALVKTVRNRGKAADVAKENRNVLKVRLKVYFLTCYSFSNILVCKAGKGVQKVKLVLGTLVKNANLVQTVGAKTL